MAEGDIVDAVTKTNVALGLAHIHKRKEKGYSEAGKSLYEAPNRAVALT